ncbi:MAG: glycosyltransferase [Planctomycetota bacterium]|nr:glycosyltransferase [Planctomycetota bacterium]
MTIWSILYLAAARQALQVTRISVVRAASPETRRSVVASFACYNSPKQVLQMSQVLVVTPAYCTAANNRLPFLLETLYWVKRQSWRNYLHIVVDDGSTDDSMDVLGQIAAADARLRIVRKSNGGSSSAINYGVDQALRIAKPEFVTICHSDDIMLPNSLAARLQTAEETGADFVHSDYLLMTEDGVVRHRRAKRIASPAELYQRLLALKKGILYPTMFWRTAFYVEKVGGFDPAITSAEDWDIALRTAKQLMVDGSGPASCPLPTMLKRNHAGCLRIQNTLDGTKERCYETIYQKHLQGSAYEAALEKVRRIKVRPPGTGWRPKRAAKAVGRALRLRRVAALLRLQSGVLLDKETERFVREMREIGVKMRGGRAA